MAKKYYKAPVHQTGLTITTKTAFGSDSSMVVDLSQYETINLNDNQVVCKDDRGFYVTEKRRIDSNMADPNRYGSLKSRITLKEKTQVDNAA